MLIFCLNDSKEMPKVQKELEIFFGNYFYIYYENKMSQKDVFFKNKRNIIITKADFLITYLRQGWISLEQINYLVFQPMKLPFGEENYVEQIINEFYFPLLNLGSSLIPKMYIINTSTDIKVSFLFLFEL